MKKSTKAVIVGMLAAGVSLTSIPAANAQQAAPEASTATVTQTLDQAREFLTLYGVPEAVQNHLVVKYQSGVIWDSMSGAAPVSTETLEKAGKTETVSRFEDGSINVTSIQKPTQAQAPGEVSVFGISECGYYKIGATENYDNCLVDFWAGLIYMGFRADYSAVDNGMDYIRSVYAADYVIGGASSADQTEFAITRQYETPGAPATARLNVLAYPAGAPFAYNFWVQLNVGTGGAYMSYSS